MADICSVNGGRTLAGTTDGKGRCTLAELPAGEYLVRVHRAGFGTAHSLVVRVTAGAAASHAVVLTPLGGPAPEGPSGSRILAAGVGAVGLVLSFATAERLQTIFDRAGGGQDALGRYAAIFEHAVTAPQGSTRLRALLDRLSAGRHPAPVCMRQLNRILGFGELRRGAAILHFPVQAVTLWDFHVLFALERWRRGSGTRVRGWLDALGELDALTQLATARRDNEGWAAPVLDASDVITADAIGHPLIPDDRRVANDVTVGPRGTALLITGSNMSGKSTLLRSIGQWRATRPAAR